MNVQNLLIPIDTHDINHVQKIAREIWLDNYQEMISLEQIDYMLNLMYSTPTIIKALEENKDWYWIISNFKKIGFVEIYPKREGTLFLSKIYLQTEFQGKGIAQEVMGMINEKARIRGLQKIELTVNKQNHKALAFYKKLGFTTSDSIVMDIGNGFVMDDYVMTYSVPNLI